MKRGVLPRGGQQEVSHDELVQSYLSISAEGHGTAVAASEHENYGEPYRVQSSSHTSNVDGFSAAASPSHFVREPSESENLQLVVAQQTDTTLENLMVTGSLTKRELSVASSIVIDESRGVSPSPAGGPCRICAAAVGSEFEACECAFRVCRPCCEYLRRHEGGRCPQCRHRYRRHKGSPPVAGDPAEEHMDYVAEQEEMRLRQQQPENVLSARNNDVKVFANPKWEPNTKLNVILKFVSPCFMVLSCCFLQELDAVHAEEKSNLRDLTDGETVTSVAPSHESLHVLDPKKAMDEYGYGSIVWVGNRSKNLGSEFDKSSDGGHGEPPEDTPPLMVDDTRRPLNRKVSVPPNLLNPYRFMVMVRLIVTILFFRFRVTNPNNAAYPLWLASVICEIWFAVSWIFDQVPKWSPVTRETHLDRLSLRHEKEGEPCSLPFVDVFVSTADPGKEPPLVTANVILSILAVDYPVDRVACYLSDDGAAMLTFEALTETANFARAWVPFCKQYDIEPRAPEMYFNQKVDYLRGHVQPEFVRERRHMKREYDEFKVRVNALVAKAAEAPRDGWRMPDGAPWPGNDRGDHVGMVQVFLQPDGETKDVHGGPLPRLVYLSREKRHSHEHNKKAGAMNALMRASALITNAPFVLNLDCDHYINNSRAIREAVCFLIEPRNGGQICFVQFPQRFDGVDRNDRYANHNTVFYDVNMKGLDGQQGPMYVGTGCVFRRQAIYGYDPPPKSKEQKKRNCCFPWLRKSRPKQPTLPPSATEEANSGNMEEYDLRQEEETLMPTKGHVKRFGMCHNFLLTTFDAVGGRLAAEDPHEVLSDVILVISCGYEYGTQWGKTCGWMYGSVTEDIVTGYMMHVRGWRSVYCIPKRPAFKGSAPINLTDRLAQVLRWATGSVEIFFSGRNPLWADCCTRLKFVERLAYINTAIYPFTSVALMVYCFLPAIGLFTNQFIIATITNWAVLYFLALFLSIFATAILEIRWSGVSLEEWWRNEQFWVIGGTSAHLAAVLQGLLKVFAGVDVHFTLTAKAGDGDDEMAELYTVRWTWLFLVPFTIIIVNALAIMAGVARAFNSGENGQLGQLVGQVFFSAWVLVHMYPFAKGLMGRSQKTPTIVIVWALLLAIVLSLLWTDIGIV